MKKCFSLVWLSWFPNNKTEFRTIFGRYFVWFTIPVQRWFLSLWVDDDDDSFLSSRESCLPDWNDQFFNVSRSSISLSFSHISLFPFSSLPHLHLYLSVFTFNSQSHSILLSFCLWLRYGCDHTLCSSPQRLSLWRTVVAYLIKTSRAFQTCVIMFTIYVKLK